MNFKTFVAAAALAAFAVPAVAQDTNANVSAEAGQQLSPTDADIARYEANPDMWSGFFTDDTWTTMRTEDEITSTFSAMTPEHQEQLQAECQEVYSVAGSGMGTETPTQSICGLVSPDVQ